ncbi:MAG: hypothetical protein M1587_10525 [Thaumarchaeota archaeon]|nr:hypothetical protein [Nitrososphaerota archaeon]
MRWILLVVLLPMAAKAQGNREPVVEPAGSIVVSIPFAPMWQLGAGVKYGNWSYEGRYGWAELIGPNVGWGTFRSFAIYARSDVSDVFYWMVGPMYVSYEYTPPYSQPDFHSTILYEHTWHSITPAVGLGVGYKYIFLELQAYYPGLLLGIRVGVN